MIPRDNGVGFVDLPRVGAWLPIRPSAIGVGEHGFVPFSAVLWSSLFPVCEKSERLAADSPFPTGFIDIFWMSIKYRNCNFFLICIAERKCIDAHHCG